MKTVVRRISQYSNLFVQSVELIASDFTVSVHRICILHQKQLLAFLIEQQAALLHLDSQAPPFSSKETGISIET